eukprot:m.340104 g.340104  ORF g.340104 m.340104 type:complete len:1345 (-) comp16098_c0_seq13:1079-5113(-)
MVALILMCVLIGHMSLCVVGYTWIWGGNQTANVDEFSYSVPGMVTKAGLQLDGTQCAHVSPIELNTVDSDAHLRASVWFRVSRARQTADEVVLLAIASTSTQSTMYLALSGDEIQLVASDGYQQQTLYSSDFEHVWRATNGDWHELSFFALAGETTIALDQTVLVSSNNIDIPADRHFSLSVGCIEGEHGGREYFVGNIAAIFITASILETSDALARLSILTGPEYAQSVLPTTVLPQTSAGFGSFDVALVQSNKALGYIACYSVTHIVPYMLFDVSGQRRHGLLADLPAIPWHDRAATLRLSTELGLTTNYLPFHPLRDSKSFPLTVSVWVFLTGTSSFRTVLSFDPQGPCDPNLYIINDKLITLWPSDIAAGGFAAQLSNISVPVPKQRWVHLTVSISTELEATYYLNGIFIGTTTGPAAVCNASNFSGSSMHVGYEVVDQQPSRVLQGLVDGIRFLNVKVDAPRASKIFRNLDGFVSVMPCDFVKAEFIAIGPGEVYHIEPLVSLLETRCGAFSMNKGMAAGFNAYHTTTRVSLDTPPQMVTSDVSWSFVSGLNSSLHLLDPPPFLMGDAAAISVWLKTSTQARATVWMFGSDRVIGTFELRLINGSPQIAMFTGLLHQSSPIIPGVNITDDVWHNVLVVRDGMQFRLAIDGTVLSLFTMTIDLIVASHFSIGAAIHSDKTLSNHYIGLLDEFQVYDTSFDADEIQELANGHILFRVKPRLLYTSSTSTTPMPSTTTPPVTATDTTTTTTTSATPSPTPTPALTTIPATTATTTTTLHEINVAGTCTPEAIKLISIPAADALSYVSIVLAVSGFLWTFALFSDKLGSIERVSFRGRLVLAIAIGATLVLVLVWIAVLSPKTNQFNSEALYNVTYFALPSSASDLVPIIGASEHGTSVSLASCSGLLTADGCQQPTFYLQQCRLAQDREQFEQQPIPLYTTWATCSQPEKACTNPPIPDQGCASVCCEGCVGAECTQCIDKPLLSFACCPPSISVGQRLLSTLRLVAIAAFISAFCCYGIAYTLLHGALWTNTSSYRLHLWLPPLGELIIVCLMGYIGIATPSTDLSCFSCGRQEVYATTIKNLSFLKIIIVINGLLSMSVLVWIRMSVGSREYGENHKAHATVTPSDDHHDSNGFELAERFVGGRSDVGASSRDSVHVAQLQQTASELVLENDMLRGELDQIRLRTSLTQTGLDLSASCPSQMGDDPTYEQIGDSSLQVPPPPSTKPLSRPRSFHLPPVVMSEPLVQRPATVDALQQRGPRYLPPLFHHPMLMATQRGQHQQVNTDEHHLQDPARGDRVPFDGQNLMHETIRTRTDKEQSLNSTRDSLRYQPGIQIWESDV